MGCTPSAHFTYGYIIPVEGHDDWDLREALDKYLEAGKDKKCSIALSLEPATEPVPQYGDNGYSNDQVLAYYLKKELDLPLPDYMIEGDYPLSDLHDLSSGLEKLNVGLNYYGYDGYMGTYIHLKNYSFGADWSASYGNEYTISPEDLKKSLDLFNALFRSLDLFPDDFEALPIISATYF